MSNRVTENLYGGTVSSPYRPGFVYQTFLEEARLQRRRRTYRDGPVSLIGRTSMDPPMCNDGMRPAIESASSRFLASTM